MIITKKVKIKIASKNIKHYKENGYKNINIFDVIEVYVSELQKYTKTKVKVKCDICGIEKEIGYNAYLKNIKKYNIYSCDQSCAKTKEHKTNIEKYGKKYKQNRSEKMIKTTKERYGENFYHNSSASLKTTDDFISEMIKIYKNEYDFSNINYINNYTKIEFYCKKHGKLLKTPNELLVGNACKKCSNELYLEKRKKNFFKKLKKNINYDYSYIIYKHSHQKIKMKCLIHNEFFHIRPSELLRGRGCPKCGIISIRLKTLKRIQDNLKNGYQITPNFNSDACKIFDEISLKEKIHIQHAKNDGEYHIKELGYWLDGYDKENNVVYEFDEKKHFINGNLKEKDIIRQQEIEYFLKCQFVRIK